MSNKTMTISELSKSSKEFKDTHTLQVGGFNGNGRVSNRDLLLAICKRLDKHDEMFNLIVKRLDNLVAKNNLKE